MHYVGVCECVFRVYVAKVLHYIVLCMYKYDKQFT